jgi:hypothetical protein
MSLFVALAATSGVVAAGVAVGLLAAHLTRHRREVDPTTLAVLHAHVDEHMRSYR